MKNILIKTIAILFVVLLPASCVKETFPKGSTVTKDQLEGAEQSLTYMLSGIPAAMMNSGAGGYASTYGIHCDYGIAAIQMATESMLEDFAVLGEMNYYWFGSWMQNSSQGSDYIWCAYFWDTYYQWIKLANEIISIVDDVNEDTNEEVKQALGQAHAYRAMLYLDLARLYEPKTNKYTTITSDMLGLTVPIVTEDTTEEIAKNNPRATREEMYHFIFSDLKKAEEYLKNAAESYTTPGLTAVYGLYARAYLELGATYAEYPSDVPDPAVFDMTSEKAYTEAAKYARMAIERGHHSPLTQAQWEDPRNGFNDGGSNNAWIWGLTVSAENLSNLIASVAHRSCEAIYGYGVWTQLGVNQALYAQISDEDFRKHSWLDPGMMEYYNYQLAGSSEEQQGFIYGSMYNYPAVAYESIKFRPADGNVMDYTVGNCADCCLMRIEEMYFIEIEAVLATQGLAAAQNLLNDFMQTYRYPGYDCYLKTLSKEAFIKEMMLQKRIEFWGEGILIYDYKRLNQSITRGYEGTNVPSIARYNSDGRSPQWNIVITRGEYQSNKGIKHPDLNNPDPTEKLTLWE